MATSFAIFFLLLDFSYYFLPLGFDCMNFLTRYLSLYFIFALSFGLLGFSYEVFLSLFYHCIRMFQVDGCDRAQRIRRYQRS